MAVAGDDDSMHVARACIARRLWGVFFGSGWYCCSLPGRVFLLKPLRMSSRPSDMAAIYGNMKVQLYATENAYAKRLTRNNCTIQMVHICLCIIKTASIPSPFRWSQSTDITYTRPNQHEHHQIPNHFLTGLLLPSQSTYSPLP